MLPKKHRLKKGRLLDMVFRKGRVVSNTFFLVRILPPRNMGVFRVCIVVSKKTEPKAVGRNTLRRRIYAILKNHLAALPSASVVILTKKDAADADFQTLEKQIKPLLLRKKQS